MVAASVWKLLFIKLACSFRLTRLLRLISLAHFYFQKQILLARGNRTWVSPALADKPLVACYQCRQFCLRFGGRSLPFLSGGGGGGVGEDRMTVLYSLDHKIRRLNKSNVVYKIIFFIN